jgi:hypothetical protein
MIIDKLFKEYKLLQDYSQAQDNYIEILLKLITSKDYLEMQERGETC